MASPSGLSHCGPFMPSIQVPHGRPLYITKFGSQMRWSRGPLWNIAFWVLTLKKYFPQDFTSLMLVSYELDDSLAQADQTPQILNSNVSPVQP